VQAIRLGANPNGWLTELWRRHGDAFVIRIPNDPPRLVLAHPDAVREVFALPPQAYRAVEQTLPLDIGRHSLLFLDDERHARSRKMLTPPLHGQRLRSYAETIDRLTTAAIARWQPGETVVLHQTMQSITLDVILECVFGVGRDDEAAGVRRVMLEWLDDALTPATFLLAIAVTPIRLRQWTEAACEEALASNVRTSWPGTERLPWRRVGQLKATVERTLGAQIEAVRRVGTEGRDDVLSMLIDARDEQGDALSTEEILDQLVTFLVGGHETTANTACWAMLHILGDPDAVRGIRDELDVQFSNGEIDPARNGELTFLEACLTEAARLSPITPAVPRTLGRDVTVAGYEVPAGAILWPSPHLAHRHPDVWDSPDSFRPERFLEAKPPRPNELFPYGGGRRRCIGAAFAQFEMRIILANMLRHCHLELVDADDAKGVIRGFSVVPENGVRVRYLGPR